MRHFWTAIKKYAVFSGRASRAEYWYFVLFNSLIAMALGIIDTIIAAMLGSVSVLSNLYQLAVLVPTVAVTVRRMHDVNKSGWFFLVPIYNLILLLRGGTVGENKFGADPKASGESGQVNNAIVSAGKITSEHE